MKSNQFADRSLRRIAEVLFAQIQHIGIFGLDLNLNKDVLDEATSRRIGFIYQYFQLLEEVAELVFEESEVPLLYRTRNWPENLPPAGYSDLENSLRPSVLLDSYLASWNFYFVSKEEDFWGGRRFLKSALWVLREDGITASITYLFDLQRNGFALDPQDIYDALSLLIKAQRIVDRDDDILKYFFGESVPKTYNDLINAEFANFDPDRPFKRAVSSEVVQALISSALDQVERIRKSENYDAWLSGQWILNPMISQIQHFIDIHCENISVSLQAILDQLEEMRADAGGIRRNFLAKMYNSTLIKSNPLLSDFVFNSNVKAAIIGIQSVRKEDWKTRLFQDRCVIPYAIQTLFVDDSIPLLPTEWRQISPNLAVTFSRVVLNEDFVPDITRMQKFTSQEILKSKASQEVFDDRNIQDPLTQRVLGMEFAGEWQRFSYKQLARELQQLSTGDSQDSTIEDDEDEFHSIRDEVNEWLDNNELDIKEIVLELREAVSTDEIQTYMDEAFSLDGVDNTSARIALLEELLENYPWYSAAHLELAITLDTDGQLQRALDHAETAIIMRPLMPYYWQSLSVILGRLGCPDETRLANAVFATLNEFDASFYMS